MENRSPILHSGWLVVVTVRIFFILATLVRSSSDGNRPIVSAAGAWLLRPFHQSSSGSSQPYETYIVQALGVEPAGE